MSSEGSPPSEPTKEPRDPLLQSVRSFVIYGETINNVRYRCIPIGTHWIGAYYDSSSLNYEVMIQRQTQNEEGLYTTCSLYPSFPLNPKEAKIRKDIDSFPDLPNFLRTDSEANILEEEEDEQNE